MIEELGFAGYFLVVWDIVEFCRRSGSIARAGLRGELGRVLRARDH